MATLESQIERMAQEKIAIQFGIGKELKRLAELIGPAETLVNMAKGKYAGKTGILAVTDRRVIFLESGIFRNTVEDFSFQNISSVRSETKMLKGDIEIMAAGNSARITEVFPKARVPEIVNYVRSRIGHGATPNPHADATVGIARQTHTVDVAKGSSDPAMRLKSLNQMKVDGLLTDDEYSEKKAEILRAL